MFLHARLAGVAIAFICCLSTATSRLLLSTPVHQTLQRAHCPTKNEKLSSWLQKEITQAIGIIPAKSTDFSSFLVELKDVLDQRNLPNRPILHILSENDLFNPTCSGDWIEAGVYTGDTINMAAKGKRHRCGDTCPPVYGFDTFTGEIVYSVVQTLTAEEILSSEIQYKQAGDLKCIHAGLPEEWATSEDKVAPVGAFNLDGKFPEVESNVQLVKGTFLDTLPLFEEQHRQHVGNNSISFLHIDCDLYSGAKDVLSLLNNRIKFGTVILFDDLVNYNNYKEGEVKALWEWLKESQAKLAVVGMLGPLEGKSFSVDLNTNEPSGEHPWFHQSAAFVVVQEPVRSKQLEEREAERRRVASEPDPVLSGAEAIKGEPGLGALGHFREKGQQRGEPLSDQEERQPLSRQPRRISRGTRDRQRAEVNDVRNREAIIPLKELETDPEGDVTQDAAMEEEIEDTELPADSKDSLLKQPLDQRRVVSNLEEDESNENLVL